MTRIRLIAAFLIALVALPTSAQAFDIPLLNWERGRVQQVVLGGGAYSAQWVVTLEGNGIAPLTFTRSEPNKAGFVVYSLDVPNDLPVGAYSVSTSGKGSPKTVVAGVALVEAQTKTATTKLIDLTIIVSIFIFLTTVVSTLRARKYSVLTSQNSQLSFDLDSLAATHSQSFLSRLLEAPYRIRLNGLHSIRISILHFLLVREGELVHGISRNLYGILPILGFGMGAVAAVETNRNGGIANTGIAVFVAITVLAIFDAYSGLLATLGFWAFELFSGNVTSFRDVLLMLAVGLTWVGTSLFSGLLKESISKDISSKDSQLSSLSKVYGLLGSAFVGTSVFYLGQALIDSIIYIESPMRSISLVTVVIVAASLFLKGVAENFATNRVAAHEVKNEEFFVARVSSPQTALLLFSVVFGFLYIWTEKSESALILAALFSLPYFLIFISFEESFALLKKLPPRNILLESALVAAVSFVAYRQISGKPFLIEERANYLLLISTVPGIIHALYSAVYASSEKKGIIIT